MKKRLASVALLIVVSTVTAFAQSAASLPREKAEVAVRSAVYQSTVSALTADVKSYKQRATRHMVDLYSLIYGELAKDAEMRRVFQQDGIKTADDFMASRLRQAAGRFADLPRAQIEELARREAAAPITFVSDDEARIRGVRVVLEDGEWKVDASEAIKVGLLRNPDNRLSAESRAKIDRF